IPKSSSALAVSFMISRSESDPITIDTSGLSGMNVLPLIKLDLRLQRAGADVGAVVHIFKMYRANSFVSSGNCGVQFWRARGNSQHTAAVRVKAVSVSRSPGMENLNVRKPGSVVQP